MPETKKIHKVLVANRGEIAVRIIRTLREMEIASVAVYSEGDARSPHLLLADESYLLGPPPPLESYLNIDRILAVAREAKADAIHPGYGFLSENSDFAQAVADAGLIFIGPSPEAIKLMGDKLNARKLAQEHRIPVIPAVEELPDKTKFLARIKEIGFPVLIKAAAGGGGKGMRVVRREEEFFSSLEMSKRESHKAFKSDRVFVEKYLEQPRHIEFQILADQHGHVVHLNERECSIQRRHQKIIEETPSPLMTEALRDEMGKAAVRLATAARYTNAGTVEFIVDQRQKKFYLLEMNTRLQVEHPVTEMTLGLDLVAEQIRIAEGAPMGIRQEAVRARGHALECRLYAEDPEQQFLPASGRLLLIKPPAGPWIRHDCGVASGLEISTFYDPMIAKLIVWGETRPAAINRMKQALRDYVLLGITTNREYLLDILDLEPFKSGELHTGFLDQHLGEWHPSRRRLADALLAAALLPRSRTASSTSGQAASAGSSPLESHAYDPWLTAGNWGR